MDREDKLYALAALVLPGLCLFGNLNTRIGWPGAYWSQGSWIATVYISVCLSLALAVTMMIHSARTGKPCCLAFVLALLVGTAAVLQWLPQADTGLQFLPVLPWAFHGWIAFLISVISWLAMAFVVIALICGDRAVGFPVMAILLLATNLPLSFWSIPPRNTEPTSKPEQVAADPLVEYRSQIAEWTSKRGTAQRVLENLRRDQQSLVERLKCLGVRTSTDLKKVPAARALAVELAEVVAQIQDQEQEIERLSTTIIESESHVRRIERRKVIDVTGLDEPDEERFIRTGVELSEMLRSDQGDLMVLEAEKVLDKTLTESGVNQQEWQ